jgi:glycosyltransferase involved in cell wall biosynthesis
VRPYLERAALMVVPLRIGGGTRLKIVEALALDTPIVSTRIGAEGLGLEHGRHLLLIDDPREFAEGVLELLEQPTRAAELGRVGCAAVHARFRWGILAQELLEYWERVAISGSPSPSR